MPLWLSQLMTSSPKPPELDNKEKWTGLALGHQYPDLKAFKAESRKMDGADPASAG
ncbi:hypothetical protein [Rossellomorea marisflavi]|uniref:hypothetical protein n=1 Tax=Rossellomorea marisflavi TaxID=189381 RepID=UPI0034596C26